MIVSCVRGGCVVGAGVNGGISYVGYGLWHLNLTSAQWYLQSLRRLRLTLLSHLLRNNQYHQSRTLSYNPRP